jgi:hypothetical protein
MRMTTAYDVAKSAKVGDYITCPSCGKKFVKKTYNQVFCSNAKTKDSMNCKDRYWNDIDPRKRNNTTRISPASQRFLDEVIIPRRERIEWEEDADPGDSEYWMNKD